MPRRECRWRRRASPRARGAGPGRRRRRSRACAPARGREEIAAAAGARRLGQRADRGAAEEHSADATVKSPVAGTITVEAGRRRRDGGGRGPRSPSSRTSITPGRTSTSTNRSCRRCAWVRRRRCVTDAGHRLTGTDHLHLAARGVHAAERADRGGAFEAGLPDQGDGRQPRGHPQAGHAGRSRAAGPGEGAVARRADDCRRIQPTSAKSYGAIKALDRRVVRGQPRRDVRRHRPGRRGQDDRDPDRVRTAAAPTAARSGCWATTR